MRDHKLFICTEGAHLVPAEHAEWYTINTMSNLVLPQSHFSQAKKAARLCLVRDSPAISHLTCNMDQNITTYLSIFEILIKTKDR